MSKRSNKSNRKDAGTYFGIPHAVLDCPNYLKLSAKAVKLLNDAGRQYNGFNNGDLCVTYSMMKERGWVSKRTLAEALEELTYYSFLILCRQGGRHQASLYALSWKPIDECKGKLDIKSSRIPVGDWKINVDKFVPKRLKKVSAPTIRAMCPQYEGDRDSFVDKTTSCAPKIRVIL